MIHPHLSLPSSAATASEVPGTRRLSRRELFLWVAAILMAACLLRPGPTTATSLPDVLLETLGSRSVFHYLAWYAVLQLLFDGRSAQTATRWDATAAVLAIAMSLLPGRTLLWTAVTLAGLHLLVAARDDRKFAAAGAVLLALAINGLWAPILFDSFALLLLRADAGLVAVMLALTHPEITWNDTVIASGAHQIIVLSQCSSFHNISLGLLCWISLNRLARPEWRTSDLGFALMVVGVVLLFNTTRLYFMALSADQYTYWHSGAGAEIFAWATPIAVIAVSVLPILKSERRA